MRRHYDPISYNNGIMVIPMTQDELTTLEALARAIATSGRSPTRRGLADILGKTHPQVVRNLRHLRDLQFVNYKDRAWGGLRLVRLPPAWRTGVAKRVTDDGWIPCRLRSKRGHRSYRMWRQAAVQPISTEDYVTCLRSLAQYAEQHYGFLKEFLAHCSAHCAFGWYRPPSLRCKLGWANMGLGCTNPSAPGAMTCHAHGAIKNDPAWYTPPKPSEPRKPKESSPEDRERIRREHEAWAKSHLCRRCGASPLREGGDKLALFADGLCPACHEPHAPRCVAEGCPQAAAPGAITCRAHGAIKKRPSYPSSHTSAANQ